MAPVVRVLMLVRVPLVVKTVKVVEVLRVLVVLVPVSKVHLVVNTRVISNLAIRGNKALGPVALDQVVSALRGGYGIVFKVLEVLKASTMALSSRGNLATRMGPDQADLVDVAGFRAFRTLVPTVIMAKLLEEITVGLFYKICWFTAKVCCEGFTLNTHRSLLLLGS
ncbi:uncharacterized protein B0T23DRAFT_440110 [Neurospora hispaniola]|uniref:Uncharacterized protein n=1 Tax=Neurospora hispaniola TaxID=588809 RepID=A0AAJ0MSJ7_9PEZI|nr:hypothetical protein B0T23DRAFT_440110 [Neurospora hispaniola]